MTCIVLSKRVILRRPSGGDEGNLVASEGAMAGREKKDGKRKVFVVHGRNGLITRSLFSFLRSIGLQPIEWIKAIALTRKASPYVGEILDAAFGHAQAVVILLTPDDEARLRPEFQKDDDPSYEAKLTGQPRPNVIFEAGMALGRDSDRTVLVEVGSLRPFTDVLGRHVVRLSDDSRRRQELAQRLRVAGCLLDTSGTDWLSEGQFHIGAETKRKSHKPGKFEPRRTSPSTRPAVLSRRDLRILLLLLGHSNGLTIRTISGKLQLGRVVAEAALESLRQRGLLIGRTDAGLSSKPGQHIYRLSKTGQTQISGLDRLRLSARTGK